MEFNILNADELIDKVIEWRKEHGVEDPNRQFVKVIEETGEIAHAMTHANSTEAELEDALGDTMITLIILADILGMDIRECLAAAYTEVHGRKGKTVNGIFIKDE